MSFREWKINEAWAITSINLLFVDGEDLGLEEKACMVRGDTRRGWQRWLRTQSSTPSHCTSPAHTAPGKRYNTAELLMHIVLRQFCCEHRMCFIPTNYLVSPTVYYARSPSQLTIVCQLLTLLCLLFQQS